ncbi:hypothetical protein EIN_031580 [Entamoeba invadens IP1]|uniref:Uncharacterized protein n=1 Tax=Entamoeba invadens IP1 TaxID=370355 RepID=A0A0A1TY43_ENTIV|nr:hypothetical protein EIN_031580 [Entamoeba invadens IP1]ELP86437.1 hypothetical protein EIN_031580 [Entamoeba invadens IP1]|eukprot:XP_004185783.1 hypothetical protein EIN_031580 [Entamoeba invadens IP1]
MATWFNVLRPTEKLNYTGDTAEIVIETTCPITHGDSKVCVINTLLIHSEGGTLCVDDIFKNIHTTIQMSSPIERITALSEGVVVITKQYITLYSIDVNGLTQKCQYSNSYVSIPTESVVYNKQTLFYNTSSGVVSMTWKSSEFQTVMSYTNDRRFDLVKGIVGDEPLKKVVGISISAFVCVFERRMVLVTSNKVIEMKMKLEGSIEDVKHNKNRIFVATQNDFFVFSHKITALEKLELLGRWNARGALICVTEYGAIFRKGGVGLVVKWTCEMKEAVMYRVNVGKEFEDFRFVNEEKICEKAGKNIIVSRIPGESEAKIVQSQETNGEENETLQNERVEEKDEKMLEKREEKSDKNESEKIEEDEKKANKGVENAKEEEVVIQEIVEIPTTSLNEKVEMETQQVENVETVKTSQTIENPQETIKEEVKEEIKDKVVNPIIDDINTTVMVVRSDNQPSSKTSGIIVSNGNNDVESLGNIEIPDTTEISQPQDQNTQPTTDQILEEKMRSEKMNEEREKMEKLRELQMKEREEKLRKLREKKQSQKAEKIELQKELVSQSNFPTTPKEKVNPSPRKADERQSPSPTPKKKDKKLQKDDETKPKSQGTTEPQTPKKKDKKNESRKETPIEKESKKKVVDQFKQIDQSLAGYLSFMKTMEDKPYCLEFSEMLKGFRLSN